MVPRDGIEPPTRGFSGRGQPCVFKAPSIETRQRAGISRAAAGRFLVAAAALLLAACAAAPTDPLAAAHAAEDPRAWAQEAQGAPWTRDRRDCVGFALRYRDALLRRGFDSADMVLANIPAPSGGGRHAVLLVKWGGRIWKLDQIEPAPVPWAPPRGAWWPMSVSLAGALPPVPGWARP